jgi:glycosyltransferase involved in cell wall biosynthesis
MPLFNGRRFLDARLDSILAQTLQDWELIVCDSYSTDGSWEYLQTFAHDPRVRLYQVPRAGIYAGWNECLRRVRGRYVTIATADDTAQPEFLERLVGVLEQHPGVFLASCEFDFINAAGEVIASPGKENPNACLGDWLTVPHRRSGWADFLIHVIRGSAWTTITSVVFRAELLAQTGLFLEHATPVVDQMWAARTALYTDTLWLPERLATWRIHDQQGSSRWNRRTGWQHVALMARTLDECASRLPAH